MIFKRFQEYDFQKKKSEKYSVHFFIFSVRWSFFYIIISYFIRAISDFMQINRTSARARGGGARVRRKRL